MKQSLEIEKRILTKDQLSLQLQRWELLGKTIAFTNGVFDILHFGHISILSKAAATSDILIVGVNSDNSVRKLKGKDRPVNDEASRALLVASLIMVDVAIIFDEETPLELIKMVQPDVLIKGGDYTIETIVGATEVIARGGRVEIIPLEKGYSSSSIISKIQETGTGL